MSILEIQKALKAAGYDPGPLDGIQGPRTLKALTDFQKAHGLSMAADQWSATEAALGGGSGGSSGLASSGSDQQTAQARYPQFAWAFNDPEVAKVLNDAVAGKWGPDEVQGAIQNTNWWKSKTDSERAWLQVGATDPKEAERRLNNYDSITKYIALSNDYGLPVSFDAAAQAVGRVVTGVVAPNALEEELRRQAKALYPQLAQQIDAGSTIADIYAPYKQMAADLLGIAPTEIKLTDPKWQAPLQVTETNGTKRVATTDEWQRMLRTDARFGYATSRSGSSDGFGIADTIAKAFGNLV